MVAVLFGAIVVEKGVGGENLSAIVVVHRANDDLTRQIRYPLPGAPSMQTITRKLRLLAIEFGIFFTVPLRWSFTV